MGTMMTIFLIIGCVVSVAFVYLALYSLCVVSGRISRMEEDEEMRRMNDDMLE